ncbi:hypothetical protein [Nonomuraea helvata]|uniref:Ig-like domain-containing protein n=1 Tax=Nonomuraea helvata TaxID=37484 RepID=A0ABV5RR38_9ACTN
MKSVGLARRVAALGASAAVLAAMAAGLVASPAQAATKAKPKVSVATPYASDRNYEGSCPVTVNFAARIKVTVKGKTKVAYRWLHGDGSKGKIKSITLKGKGTKSVTVRQSVTFDEDVQGWEAVQVLGPRKVTSGKGYFSVSCQEPKEVRSHLDPKVSARAWASPDSYTGPCTYGDKIGFVGLIHSDSPAWVRYRWILNGDVVDYGKVRVYDSRRVYLGISPRHSQRGWAQLEVLSPEGTSSNRAYYRVWCQDEAPDARVSASASVSTTSACTLNALGTITSTGRARVSWTWSLNGKAVSSGTEYFGWDGGTKSVDSFSKTLSGDDAKGGTVTLSITGPDNSATITKSYAPCSTPTPTPTPTPSSSSTPA